MLIAFGVSDLVIEASKARANNKCAEAQVSHLICACINMRFSHDEAQIIILYSSGSILKRPCTQLVHCAATVHTRSEAELAPLHLAFH